MAPETDPAAPGLLTLPREIRLQIYDYLILQQYPRGLVYFRSRCRAPRGAFDCDHIRYDRSYGSNPSCPAYFEAIRQESPLRQRVKKRLWGSSGPITPAKCYCGSCPKQDLLETCWHCRNSCLGPSTAVQRKRKPPRGFIALILTCKALSNEMLANVCPQLTFRFNTYRALCWTHLPLGFQSLAQIRFLEFDSARVHGDPSPQQTIAHWRKLLGLMPALQFLKFRHIHPLAKPRPHARCYLDAILSCTNATDIIVVLPLRPAEYGIIFAAEFDEFVNDMESKNHGWVSRVRIEPIWTDGGAGIARTRGYLDEYVQMFLEPHDL